VRRQFSFFGPYLETNYWFAESVDGKNCNTIFWSPKGRHVIFATIGSSSKFDCEFWDLDLDPTAADADAGAGIQALTTVEHYGLTGIEWDPSGRYVASFGSIWENSVSSRATTFCLRQYLTTRAP
jgi:translation initiation factor 3 subunit B